MEASSRKLIGFSTVRRAEVNNRSPNCELEGTRRFLTSKNFFCNIIYFINLFLDLLSKNIQISSVTTDGSAVLKKNISEEFPNIKHYLDLYHILRAMYRIFVNKFNRVSYIIYSIIYFFV